MKHKVKDRRFLLLLMICLILPMMKSEKTYAATVDNDVDVIVDTPAWEKRDRYLLERPVLSCTDQTASKVYLKWSKVEDAVKYYIYRANKKDGSYKKLGSTNKITYTDKTVKAGKTYYYKIYASGSSIAGHQLISRFSKRLKVTVKTKVKKTAYVGDSIMSGLGCSNVVNEKNGRVISKIGVTPDRFYKGSIMDTLLKYNPDRMFIMLGMNSLVGKPSNSTMENALKYYKKIIRACLQKNPDMQIIVLPVSPTRSTARVSNTYIKQFNVKLKAMAKECQVYYYDYTSFIKNSDGALKSKYNGGDGLHWKASAYPEFKKALDTFGKTLN